MNNFDYKKYIAEGKLLKEEGYSESVNEAKAEPIVDLLDQGKWANVGMGEKKLVKLSDAFDAIGDEQADAIASHLNMAIELMQEREKKSAVPHMNKFNKACVKELKLMKKQGLAESVNEAKQPKEKDLSIINKARAKAALRQIKKGKRDDGMGKFTDRLFGVSSSGEVQQISNENDINMYKKFGLAESVNEAKRPFSVEYFDMGEWFEYQYDGGYKTEKDAIEVAKEITGNSGDKVRVLKNNKQIVFKESVNKSNIPNFENFNINEAKIIKDYMSAISIKDFKNIKKGDEVKYMGGTYTVTRNNGYTITLQGSEKHDKAFDVNYSMFNHGGMIIEKSSSKDGGDKSNSKSHHDDHTNKSIAQHWKDTYGEEFHSKYPAIAKIVKSRPGIDRRELKRIWDETYGENFEEQYPALWQKLD